MIEQLIDKIVNYKDPSTILVNQGTYYVETTDDASYLVCPESVVSFVNDGRVLRLSTRCNMFEWKLHNDLYEITTKSNDCRIEIPVKHYPITIQNKEYFFFEVLRPNNELGSHFVDEIKLDVINDNYIEQYINETTIMLRHLKTLCTTNNHHYVPRELLAPYKRNKDSIGHFWIDFKVWSFPFDKFIEKKLRTLYLTMLSLGEDFEFNRLMKLAEKEWKFFYE